MRERRNPYDAVWHLRWPICGDVVYPENQGRVCDRAGSWSNHPLFSVCEPYESKVGEPMKPAVPKRQPKGIEFQSAHEPDMTRMVKALRAVFESRPRKEQVDKAESESAGAGKQAV